MTTTLSVDRRFLMIRGGGDGNIVVAVNRIQSATTTTDGYTLHLRNGTQYKIRQPIDTLWDALAKGV